MAAEILTKEMVLAALHKDKGSEATLTDWSEGLCGKETDIYFNAVRRITVSYTIQKKPNKVTYVAKVNPCRANDKFNPYRHHAVKKEIFFYEELLPLLNDELKTIDEPPLKVPKCYFTSDEYGKEVIIFEDLCASGYETRNPRVPMDFDHGEVMMKELARVGAASHLLLKKYSYITETFPLLIETWNLPNSVLWEGFQKLFEKGTRIAIAASQLDDKHKDLTGWLRSVLPRTMDILREHVKPLKKWELICHGDFHRVNVMFKYDSDKKPVDVMIHDWQTLRLSTYGMEINYSTYMSYSPQGRLAVKDRLSDTYFTALNSLLKASQNFSLAELTEHIENNHYGYMLGLYLLPLSMSIENGSEFFNLDESCNMSEQVALEKVTKWSKEKQNFHEVCDSLLEEAKRLDLPTKI